VHLSDWSAEWVPTTAGVGRPRSLREGARTPTPQLLPGGPLRCASISGRAEFLALETAWRDLFAQTAVPSPFHTWDFAVEWWRTFVCGELNHATGEFEVVVVRDAHERAVAILPFYFERSRGVAELGLTLQPFGRSGLTETMTDEPIALYRSGYEAKAVDAVRAHLMRTASERRWDIASIRAAAGAGPRAAQPSRFGGSLSTLEVERLSPAPLVVRPATSWETYRATLSKSMRDNLAYYPKRLTREVGPWDVHVVRSPDRIDEATDILVDLHHKRSRASAGVPHKNHIATAEQAAFLKSWFRRAAQAGDVEIYLLTVASTVIAAQAFMSAPSCKAVYYSGFEERFCRYSPLTIITAEFLRSAMNNRAGRVEFPPLMTAWKSRWSVREQPSARDVALYALGPNALARGVARRLYGFATSRGLGASRLGPLPAPAR
jgi:CelD/BcsL family acetyltransferase involved in cellulose biosynthesis